MKLVQVMQHSFTHLCTPPRSGTVTVCGTKWNEGKEEHSPPVPVAALSNCAMTSLALVALILLQCHQGSLECQASPGTFPPLGPGCGECQGGQWGWGSCTDKIENLDAHDGVCVRDACVLLEATHTQHLNTVKDEAEQEATLATHTQHLNTAEDNTQGHTTPQRTLEANTQHPKTATDNTKHHKTPKTTQDTHTHITKHTRITGHPKQHRKHTHTTTEHPKHTQTTPQHHHHHHHTHTKHTPSKKTIPTNKAQLIPSAPSIHPPPWHPHPLGATRCLTPPCNATLRTFTTVRYTKNLHLCSGKDSALEGVDSVEALQNRLHLSTALGHNGFLFHVTAVPRDAVQGEVWSLDHHTLVMARFKPDNLFHVLHDDVMPVYFTVLRLCAVLGSPCPPITLLAVDEHTESPYSALYSALGHQLLLARDLQNIVWLRLSQATVGLSHHSVWYQYGFRRPQGPVETRLSGAELREFAVFVISRLGVGINTTTDAVKDVGVAAENLWGVGVDTVKDIPKNSLETRENDIENLENYLVSQGNTLENVGNSLDICGNALQSTKNTPGSANKPKNTLENILEPAENTLENTLGLSNAPEHTPGLANLPEPTPTNTPASQPSPSTRQSPPLAVLLTRRTTRKILNEKQLVETIQRELNKTYGEGVVRIMSLEEDGLDEAIRAVSQARVLVGMHGAGLGLGMFMSSGTLLIEMWPFGVDPASARVYRAMCGLTGFGVTYRAWVNEDVGNTRTHPHYPPHFGGVRHLPQEERKRVVSSLRGDKLVNVTCCMDVDWLYRIYQDTVLPRTPPPGRVHKLTCSLQTHNEGTKLELSWQTPWIVRSLGCGDLVYEVVMAEHSEARARTVFVRRERMVLVFNKRLGFVDVWVTSFCDGVEGLAVFVSWQV
ncbi:hypothetical protein O3P69_019105 [Scylla paramamosain]|uniref:Glycosyltransferase 61 catalytic domain-containing protein n=1 Tax=Scylla paramamosain TaxID=85552 RepID=A0AAW0SVF0_SCYPA